MEFHLTQVGLSNLEIKYAVIKRNNISNIKGNTNK